MTKEQETIERLNRFKTIKVLYENTFAMHTEQLKTLQEDLETVLNMLNKKDKETEKKDKIIDLMARAFKQDDVRTVEEIKQYFERKAKDGRN